MKQQTDALAEMLKQCDAETILRAASLCSGHAIIKAEALIENGMPAAVVNHLTKMHRSNGTLKGALYVAGKRVKQLRGVDGLDMLRFLAESLGIHFRRAFGRGSEARNIQLALRHYFRDCRSEV